METKYVRVPFEVELAKKITKKSVEGKIVTRNGESARIVCFDRKDEFRPIIALINSGDIEIHYAFCVNGKFVNDDVLDTHDLMLEIPEYMTFKDGDILYVKLHNDNWYVFIYRDNGKDKAFFYAALDHEGELFIGENRITSNDDISELRFSTESEKQSLIDALKAREEPKAKEYLKRFFGIEQKAEYEFKAKDWVLVRGSDYEWHLDIFSHKMSIGGFSCVGGIWSDCIPYNEQTEHLLGTTENYE